MPKLLSQSDMHRRKHIMSQLKGLRYCLYNILPRLENTDFYINLHTPDDSKFKSIQVYIGINVCIQHLNSIGYIHM